MGVLVSSKWGTPALSDLIPEFQVYMSMSPWLLDGYIKPNTYQKELWIFPRNLTYALSFIPCQLQAAAASSSYSGPKPSSYPWLLELYHPSPTPYPTPHPNYQQVPVDFSCKCGLSPSTSITLILVEANLVSLLVLFLEWDNAGNLPGKALGTKYSMSTILQIFIVTYYASGICQVQGRQQRIRPAHGKCNNPVWYMPWKEKYWVFLRSM